MQHRLHFASSMATKQMTFAPSGSNMRTCGGNPLPTALEDDTPDEITPLHTQSCVSN